MAKLKIKNSKLKNYLTKLPKDILRLVSLVSEISAKSHMPAYLVGGVVRDLILGVKNWDLDIVIEGDGIKFAQDLARVLKAKITCHIRFGTATITLPGNIKIDIATARKEIYPAPGQLPRVWSGSLKDDLYRRDFSVNAMALSLSATDFAKVIDLFKGLSDLRRKKIRILHDASFIDDPTRMLRAIRFEQRYSFKIEAHTLRLLKEAARVKMLEKVQAQRLRDELVLILKEKEPLKCLKRIKELIGFKFINRHLIFSQKAYKLLGSAKKEIIGFKKKYPQRRQLDIWLVYFMGLLDSLKLGDARSICKGFAFRRGEEKRIISYKNINQVFLKKLSIKGLNPPEVFSLLEPLSYEVILLMKTKYKNKEIQKHIIDFFEIYNGMRLVISGDDLHRLGVKPGPYYQKIFAKVLKAKLEGLIRTREEELGLIRKLIGKR